MNLREAITTCPVCGGPASRDSDAALPNDGDGIRCVQCSPPASGSYWMSGSGQVEWANSNPTPEQRMGASEWIRSRPASAGQPPQITSYEVRDYLLR